MVFCGKPSKGCGQCRSRKIRCDQARPACSQCTKASRVCSGYRDELSLMFRDESQQVVRKAKAASSDTKSKTTRTVSRASRRSSPRSSQSDTEVSVQGQDAVFDFNTDLQQDLMSPIAEGLHGMQTFSVTNMPWQNTGTWVQGAAFDFSADPQQDEMWQIATNPLRTHMSFIPTDFEATCFFMRHNTWPGAFWTKGTIPDFFGPGGSVSQRAIKASIISAGTATLSRVTRSQPLKLAAERRYVSALALLNEALSDSVEAKANSTLAAIIVLALFEVITCRAPRNIDNWTNHIYGAASLLELRGRDQLMTEEGLGLFLQLRFQIIITCLQRATHVPRSLLECSQIAIFLRPQAEAHGDRLICICAQLANLLADIKTSVISDTAKILKASYAIEGELMAWLAALPPVFSYTTVENDTLDLSFKRRCQGILPYNNKYHIYLSFWLSNAWNNYRSVRIMNNHLILENLKKLSASKSAPYLCSDLQGQLRIVKDTIDRLAEDICASVPYSFGAGAVEYTEGWAPNPDSFLGGYILLWPLFLAGTTKDRGHPMRVWITDCLKHIAHNMGIDQALALVDIMESKDPFSSDTG